jgi:hypothetical protein
MRLRFTKFVLLASFIYWSTGLAQDLHERYEHHHDPAPIAAAAAGDQAHKPLQAPDDHDDCLICQTLKDMRVEPIVPPAMPQPALEWVQILSIIHRQAPVVCFIVFIPARAPPAAVRFISVQQA